MIFSPPDCPKIEGPLVFLGGPVQGAPDWQATAIAEVQAHDVKLHIANPRCKPFPGNHDANIDWQVDYMARAAENGVVLFWLPREIKHRCDRTYAQDVRVALGEYLSLSLTKRIFMAVGVERGFTGEYYVRRRVLKHYPNVPLCRTLRQTCAVAVELLRRDRAHADWLRDFRED
jgi:hypothetical protein